VAGVAAGGCFGAVALSLAAVPNQAVIVMAANEDCHQLSDWLNSQPDDGRETPGWAQAVERTGTTINSAPRTRLTIVNRDRQG
jgi:hypothetical protein